MVLKYLIGSILLTLPILLSAQSTRIPQHGVFPDGTQVFWLCEPGMKGNVRVLIVTPDGLRLPAELPCKSPTEKDI